MLEKILVILFCVFIRTLTGARAIWRDTPTETKARVYYANHTSHGDFLILWALLPPAARAKTRPVAGADYWLKNRIKRYLIERVFRGVIVGRADSVRSPALFE